VSTILTNHKASLIPASAGWDRGLGYAPSPPNPRFREFRKLLPNTVVQRRVMIRKFWICKRRSLGDSPAVCCIPRRDSSSIQKARPPFQTHGHPVSIKNTSRTAGSTILLLSNGYQATADDDPMVRIAEQALEGFTLASEPNEFIADNFPFCKLVFLSELSGN